MFIFYLFTAITGASCLLLTKEEVESCVRSVNSLRNNHTNTNGLNWNTNLANEAHIYATTVASTITMNGEVHFERDQRSEANGWGENNYFSIAPRKLKCADADLQWYGEINDYDKETDEPRDVKKTTRHFTQLVWKGTTEYGVGIVSKEVNNGIATVIIAKYSRAGNVNGEYKENVGELKEGQKMWNKGEYQIPSLAKLDPSLCKDAIPHCSVFVNMKYCDLDRMQIYMQKACYKSCYGC